MSYYEKSKTSPDGQPVWESYLPIILKIIPSKSEWKSHDLKAQVADTMGLPAKLRRKSYGKSKYDDNIPESRAGFALSLLNNAGLIDFLGAAKYAHNAEGDAYYKDHRGHIIESEIKELSTYQEHMKLVQERRRKKNNQSAPTKDEGEDADYELPIEVKMTDLQSEYNDSVATELLERIWKMNPYQFEKLVVDLLIEMGYKGDNGSAFVTKRTNDGGIDGVINQDPLGTQTVYVQAKRYGKSNSVQRPEISSFYGAIAETHSNKGVFITSSSFSSGAVKAAHQLGILIIDGIQLTELMIKYQVGIRQRYQYVLYDVDEDFFESD